MYFPYEECVSQAHLSWKVPPFLLKNQWFLPASVFFYHPVKSKSVLFAYRKSFFERTHNWTISYSLVDRDGPLTESLEMTFCPVYSISAFVDEISNIS